MDHRFERSVRRREAPQKWQTTKSDRPPRLPHSAPAASGYLSQLDTLRLVTLTTAVRSGTTVLPAGQINSCDAARRRVARTATLTVNLPSNAATRPLERPFSGGALPIALDLILLPIMGRLTRGSRRQMGLVLAAAGIAAGLSGCGGGAEVAAIQLRRRRPTCWR
jgi:hypothetical protein